MKKNLINLLRKMAVTIAISLIAAPAFAQSVLMTRDDFQSYTAGALLPTAAEAGMHGAYSYAAAPGEIFVGTDPLDPTNKAARVSRGTTGNTYLYASALSGTIKTFDQLSAASQGLRFSYDVYVSGSNLNQFYVQMQYGNSGSSPLAAVYFKPSAGNNLALEYLVAGGTPLSLGLSISANTWYTLTYNSYQLENDSWALSADMMNKSTGVLTNLFSDQVASISNTSVNSFLRATFFQAGTAGNENFSYVDNLSLQVVPEPTTFCLLGFGILALLVRRRIRP